MEVLELRARLRKRGDRDIRLAIKRLHLDDDEVMSDLVREGVRKELRYRGVLETIDDMKVLERSEEW